MMIGGRLDVGGGLPAGGGRDVGGLEAVGCPPPRNGGRGMFVGNVVGNVIGPEPNGFGIVVVGADDVAVPDGCGAVVVPEGGGCAVFVVVVVL